ncbi:hypothetical protein [Bradyrhizobium guangzhouense]|uniref:Uncharacterized protein n=1 Tax=Bradyrhizobium guangzhouense TaxID=1325095 RepID=A0AAE5WZK1_9BRAD|nr:hypothetical protein [Bradyrhizobium guangzhouense]QAU46132.1 hypothetical protein XH91_12660 [Bradyrhizobium guangzhouense]
MGDYLARLWEFGWAVITYWLWWVTTVPFLIDQLLSKNFWHPETIERIDQFWPPEKRHRLFKRLAIFGLALGSFLAFDHVNSELKSTREELAAARSLRSAPAEVPKPPIVADQSIFRSTQYKENLSNRLDRISEQMNKTDQGIFIPANQVLLDRFLARPVGEAKGYLDKLDGIRAASKAMETSLYDDLLGQERDYRVEINRILFPKEPLINFMIAADAYRNNISVWMKLNDTVPAANSELRQMVVASANSFGKARDELLKWVSQRQDLVEKSRRELHG